MILVHLGADARVDADRADVERVAPAALDDVEGAHLAVHEVGKVGKARLFLAEHFDEVVARATGEVRHGDIAAAGGAVDALVERAVAAAGIHPQLLAGSGLRRDFCARVHGRGGDVDLVSVRAALKRAARLLGHVFAPVLAAGDGIDDEQMFHSEFLHFRQNNTTTIPRAARTRKRGIANICGFLTTGVSICAGLPAHTSFVYWNRSQRSVPL